MLNACLVVPELDGILSWDWVDETSFLHQGVYYFGDWKWPNTVPYPDEKASQPGRGIHEHEANAAVQLYNADEIFGWASVRIDRNIFRIKNGAGETIAAFGDQGNIYLRGEVFEWCSQAGMAENPEKEEFLVTSAVSGEVVGKIGPIGNLFLRGGYHEGMDDLNDTCDTASPCPPEASEQYYLDHAPSTALKIVGPSGTVAYIDSGTTFPSGEGEPYLGVFGGNVRLRGRVFENWSHWDYWD